MDDLTDVQIDELRADLLKLRENLRAFLKSSLEGSKPIDLDEPIGRLSRMEAIQQQQMTAAARSRSSLRLRQVEGAMQRITRDDYGFCIECDDAIGHKRLKARPETPMCVGCQDVFEGA